MLPTKSKTFTTWPFTEKNLMMPGMHRQGARYQNQCGGEVGGATPNQAEVGSTQRVCEEQKVRQQTNTKNIPGEYGLTEAKKQVF